MTLKNNCILLLLAVGISFGLQAMDPDGYAMAAMAADKAEALAAMMGAQTPQTTIGSRSSSPQRATSSTGGALSSSSSAAREGLAAELAAQTPEAAAASDQRRSISASLLVASPNISESVVKGVEPVEIQLKEALVGLLEKARQHDTAVGQLADEINTVRFRGTEDQFRKYLFAVQVVANKLQQKEEEVTDLKQQLQALQAAQAAAAPASSVGLQAPDLIDRLRGELATAHTEVTNLKRLRNFLGATSVVLSGVVGGLAAKLLRK